MSQAFCWALNCGRVLAFFTSLPLEKMQVNDEGLLGKKQHFWFCGFLIGQSWNDTFHESAGV